MSIECRDIKKTYKVKKQGAVHALKGISLSIKQGEIYGVLGQNGAGKTTLIQILSTQLKATNGTAQIIGLDVEGEQKQIRKRINVINGGEEGLYPWFSARQMLEYFAYLYKTPRKLVKDKVETLLDMVGLEMAARDRATMSLSKGMKQRVMIAKGLINDPEVIFLDEPTIGLDVKAVRDTRKLILKWASEGKTIILTSHNMGDIEAVCDRLCIIKDGVICFEKRLADLKQDYRTNISLTLRGGWKMHQAYFEDIGTCHLGEQLETTTSFTISLKSGELGKVYQYFADNSQALVTIDVQNQSLEGLYLDIIEGGEGNV